MEPSPRRTKLVCTIGPASEGRVPELVDAGMDVARINFSHGSPESHAAIAEQVRAASRTADRPIAILVDLAGPKIRLGDLADGAIELETGQPFALDPGAVGPGTAERAGVTYPGLAGDLETGDRILLADGAAELVVVGTDAGAVRTEVVRGGEIRSRAGVSVPSERLSTPALTDKDREDVPRAVAIGADYIGQSFVRRPDDVRALRRLLGEDGPRIVAKIETRPAIDELEAILDEVDAVMVARGDLGVELPYEEVPIIQKQLVRRALDRGVPTIVATQMLESMTTAPRPTRAEASDVANAVFDGADAIMLSGETAIGRYPLLAAEAAVRIARLCEERGERYLPAGRVAAASTDADAVAYAAVALASAEVDVAAIACFTRTGRTARSLAALRPRVPIIAFSTDPRVLARLALVRGIVPRPCEAAGDTAGRLDVMASLLADAHALPPGSAVVLVASTAAPGTGPNTLEVQRVPG